MKINGEELNILEKVALHFVLRAIVQIETLSKKFVVIVRVILMISSTHDHRPNGADLTHHHNKFLIVFKLIAI